MKIDKLPETYTDAAHNEIAVKVNELINQKNDSDLRKHIQRHKELHRYLDELLADMIDNTEMLPSTTTVMQLMEWSHEQTKNPVTKSN